MDIKYFETVVAVADNLSYYKTAEKIHISQSSVSRQIKSVEDELGTCIFKHIKGGKVELTEYGKAMLPVIHTILSNFKYMEDSANKISQEGQNKFRLGVLRGPFNSKTRGRILYKNYMEHPEMLLTLSSVSRSDALDQIASGDLDAAILYDSFRIEESGVIDINTKQYNVIPLFKKMPCIAMAGDHLLARFPNVDAFKLKYETFVVGAMHSQVKVQHDSFIDYFKKQNIEPKMRTLSVETYADTRDAAVVSRGWMYPTFQTKIMGNDGIVFVPLEDPTFYCIYYMITPKKTNKFTEMIKNMMLESLIKDDPTCEKL